MPRSLGRPSPSAYYLLSPSLSHPLPKGWKNPFPLSPEEEIWLNTAIVRGLIGILERRDPRWLKLWDRLDDFSYRFKMLALQRGANDAAKRLAAYIARLRPPRKNAVPCDPLRLLFHYELAKQTFESEKVNLRRVRSIPERIKRVREVAPTLYEQLTSDPYRCACACVTTAPPALEAWLKTRRTPREIVEYLLAHHHGLTPSSLRRLLDEGARRLRRTR